MTINRRDFVKAFGAATAAGAIGFPFIVQAGSKAKVVVVGGGYGGATAAKYLRKYNSDIDVTLVEKEKHFYSCPFSNELISG